MNITRARRIANNVGGHFTNDERRNAFYRLDMSVMADRTPFDVRTSDKRLAQNIWDWFGNLGTKGKETA